MVLTENREMEGNPTNIHGTLIVERAHDLAAIGDVILPLIKSHKWIVKARELVMKHPHRSQMISKRLGTTDFAVAYVIYEDAKKTCTYINQNDLKAWHMNETELWNLSLKNIRLLLDDAIPNTEEYFRETQTGVCYFEKLGDFSASVLLLHEVVSHTCIARNDQIFQVPKSDLLLVAKATDAMATCVMGDISLRFNGSKSFLELQPIAYRNGWVPYVHSKVEHQFPVPLSKDEIKIYRKAIFR